MGRGELELSMRTDTYLQESSQLRQQRVQCLRCGLAGTLLDNAITRGVFRHRGIAICLTMGS